MKLTERRTDQQTALIPYTAY